MAVLVCCFRALLCWLGLQLWCELGVNSSSSRCLLLSACLPAQAARRLCMGLHRLHRHQLLHPRARSRTLRLVGRNWQGPFCWAVPPLTDFLAVPPVQLRELSCCCCTARFPEYTITEDYALGMELKV